MTNLENQLQCIAEFIPNALKQFFFVLMVFITAESMSCIHIKQYISGVNEKSACTFNTSWNKLVTFPRSPKNDSISKDRLKRPISLFLEMVFETAIPRTT